MAFISSCQVCGVQTINKRLCDDCKEELAYAALDNDSINKEEIRKQVTEKRLERLGTKNLAYIKQLIDIEKRSEENSKNSTLVFKDDGTK